MFEMKNIRLSNMDIDKMSEKAAVMMIMMPKNAEIMKNTKNESIRFLHIELYNVLTDLVPVLAVWIQRPRNTITRNIKEFAHTICAIRLKCQKFAEKKPNEQQIKQLYADFLDTAKFKSRFFRKPRGNAASAEDKRAVTDARDSFEKRYNTILSRYNHLFYKV